MNRILPTNLRDAYFKEWRASQKTYVKRAEEYFHPLPIFKVNLFRDEVLGFDRLKTLAQEIYGDRNPLDRFYQGEPLRFRKENGEYRLNMRLPFIVKGDVELNKLGDELIIRVGGFKKHLLLPRQVAASKSVKAKLEDDQLRIYFKGEEDHG
jgi:arsenite-transporting ATPase